MIRKRTIIPPVETKTANPRSKTTSVKPTPSGAAKKPIGRPKGSGSGKSPDAKIAFTIRVHPDVLARLRDKGKNWRQFAAELITNGV